MIFGLGYHILGIHEKIQNRSDKNSEMLGGALKLVQSYQIDCAQKIERKNKMKNTGRK